MTDSSQSQNRDIARRGSGRLRLLKCPGCKAIYRLRFEVEGRRVRCKHCAHVWREERAAVRAVSDALSDVADTWSNSGSTMIEGSDHASTLGAMVNRSADQARPPAGDWIGKTLGRYHLKAVLGQGAMGYVYEGFDADLKRPVALKLLSGRQSGGKPELGLRMFLQEARVAAKLQHPNIVTVYEIGEENGTHFFAMELVHGTTLMELVHQAGPLPARQACFVISRVASALARGHSAGIVHRDVKPGNIMIDSMGTVKLTDFGLADVEGIEGVREMSERALGTPGWISPEVARGEKASPASDLYGLGLTLYYAMSGNRAIRAKSRSDMIRMQRAARSFKREQLPGEWPPRIKDIVVQCLQADPANRYQSARNLARDLSTALTAEDDDATVVLDHEERNGPPQVLPWIGWTVLILLLVVAILLAVWALFLK